MGKYKVNHLKILNQMKLLTDHEINKVKKEYSNCAYNTTVEVLLYFDKTLLSLLTSILFLEKEPNSSYSQNIIYRSILEIHFKAWIIFYTVKDYGMKYAKLFLNDYAKYEFTGYINKMKPFFSETESKEILDLINQIPADIPKEAHNTFKWTGILELLNKVGVNENNNMSLDMKNKFIVEYSRLCSYVHGGYDAIEAFYQDIPGFTPKENMLTRSLNFFIYNRCNIFILFGFENEKNYLELITKIQELQKSAQPD